MRNPGACNTFVDAMVFDANPELGARLRTLYDEQRIQLVVPYAQRDELFRPNTPPWVRQIAADQIFTIPTQRTPAETNLRRDIGRILQGNAAPGKHEADAEGVFEASKYGCYFVTEDNRILGKRDELSALTDIAIVNLNEYLEFVERFKAREGGDLHEIRHPRA